MIIRTVVVFKHREVVATITGKGIIDNAFISDLKRELSLSGHSLTAYPEALTVDTSRNTEALICKMKNILNGIK